MLFWYARMLLALIIQKGYNDNSYFVLATTAFRRNEKEKNSIAATVAERIHSLFEDTFVYIAKQQKAKLRAAVRFMMKVL